ncbi:MAG: SRPBCC family protein [Actinobacteria bacterium]|nr:SRPBCC family protein [Actinomycetota bacterium]
MAQVEQSIEVNVPVDTAYNQWTQFEDFPQFMEGVERVKQIDDTRLHWEAEIAGKREEWDAEITEQIPDERVAWTAREGKGNSGVVTFHRLAPDRTKVMVQLDWPAQGLVEKVGSAVGADERRVKNDLERFKGLIESRGQETGAWRGEVEQGEVVKR